MKRTLSCLLVLTLAMSLFAACGNPQTPQMTTSGTSTAVTTPKPTWAATTAATTEPVQTTTTTSTTTAATTTEPPMTTTEPDAFAFSELFPWEWWDLPEGMHPYFNGLHWGFSAVMEPWDTLRTLGEEAYVPLEQPIEEIVTDASFSIVVEFWDVNEQPNKIVYLAELYPDYEMRQMILVDRERAWRVEGEALYRYFGEQLFNFRRVLASWEGGDGLRLELLNQDGRHPVQTNRINDGATMTVLAGLLWAEVDAVGEIKSDYTVTCYAEDGSTLTFFGGSDLVCWRTDEGEFWYHLKPKSSEVNWFEGCMAEQLQTRYAECYTMREIAAFAADGTPEEIVDRFLNEVWREQLLSVPRGTSHSVLDFDVLEYRVLEVSADGNAIEAHFKGAALPENIENTYLLEGNGFYGAGEYEDWVLYFHFFALVKGEDGLWRCGGFGTGR